MLASSALIPVQCLAVGDHAVGYQFHAEFTPQTVESWSALPGYIAALDRALGEDSYQKLRREALPLMPAMAKMTRRLYDNLAKAAGLVR